MVAIPPIIETPNAWAAYAPIIAGVARSIIAALGGAGFAWAKAVTGDQVEMAVSAAMLLAAALWSGWQKIAAIRAARRLAVAAAVQSAVATQETGQPVAVIPPSPPGTTAAQLNRAELERIQLGGRP